MLYTYSFRKLKLINSVFFFFCAKYIHSPRIKTTKQEMNQILKHFSKKMLKTYTEIWLIRYFNNSYSFIRTISYLGFHGNYYLLNIQNILGMKIWKRFFSPTFRKFLILFRRSFWNLCYNYNIWEKTTTNSQFYVISGVWRNVFPTVLPFNLEFPSKYCQRIVNIVIGIRTNWVILNILTIFFFLSTIVGLGKCSCFYLISLIGDVTL